MISYLLNHNYNMSLVHHVAPLALGTAAGDAHHKPVLKPCFLNSDPQFTDLLVCMYVNVLYHYIPLSGWWLGTFLFFSIYWEFHHPNWLFFFRGVGQTSIKWCFHMASIRVTLGDLVGRGSPIWWWLSKRGARCEHNWHIKWIRSVLRQGWCNNALEGSWKPMKTP